MIKFLHIGDIHLDAKFSNFPGEISIQRRQDQRNDFELSIDLAIKKNVDFVLLPGDLFDSDYPSIADLEFAKKCFKKLITNGIKVLLMPGTHDSYFENCIWDQDLFPGTYLLKSSELDSIEFPEFNLEIFAIGFCKNETSKRKLENLKPEIKQKHSILMFHGSLENFGQKLKNDYPFTEEDINKLPFDYIALGHYHNLQKVGNKAYYTGSISPLRFKTSECGARHVVYGEISYDIGLQLEPIELETTQYIMLDIDVSLENVENIYKKLETIENPNKKFLKVNFIGFNEEFLNKEIAKLRDYFMTKFKYIDITSKLYELPKISSEDRFMSVFKQKIEHKIKNNPDKKELLNEAFKITLSAFREK